MALRKNPGPQLQDVLRGIIDVVPLRWRSKLGLVRTKQEQPTDINADALTSSLIQSSVVQERTDERLKTNTYINDPTGQTMIEYVRTKEGQVGTRTVSYVPEGTTPPTFDELTQEFSQEASGNGWSEQILVTVPNLFNGYDYSIERRDTVPLEFGALLQTRETSHTIAGTAAMPTLGTGELMRREQQVDVATKRVTVRDRDIATLPKTIVNKDTSRVKQVITITKIWELDSTTPAVPSATQDVSFEKLGDGTAIETRKVETVFPGPVYAKSIENNIPTKFRAHIATSVSEITSTGTANTNPTLGTGELSHEEQQIDAFNIRTKSVTFGTLSLPVTFTDEELTEEFGGGVVDVIYKLNVSGTYTIDEGLRIVVSELTNLGNGYEILTTKKLQDSSWPTLVDDRFDKEMQVRITEEEQTVDPTYTPVDTTYSTERLKGIDWVRAKRIKLSKTPSAVDLASALIEEVDAPFQFPGLIYAVTGGYYRRQASAQLCQHKLRTWWLHKTSFPTRGLPGSGADVEVQDIIMDDIIISELNDVTRLAYSGMCLHDAITTFGTFVYTATEPSATAYIALIGTEIVTAASIESTDIPELWKITTKSVVAR